MVDVCWLFINVLDGYTADVSVSAVCDWLFQLFIEMNS